MINNAIQQTLRATILRTFGLGMILAYSIRTLLEGVLKVYGGVDKVGATLYADMGVITVAAVLIFASIVVQKRSK